MPRFQDLSIKRKFLSVMVLIGVAALILIAGVLMFTDFILFKRTMIRELTTLAEVIGTNSTASLSFNDQRSAEETLSAVKADPNIIVAHIYTKDLTLRKLLIAPIHSKDLTLFASYLRKGEKNSPFISFDQIEQDGIAFRFKMTYRF